MTLVLCDITSGEMTFERLDRLSLTQNKDPLFLTTRLLMPINRGYYTVARRYEFYFRVAKHYFTNERSE